MGSNSRKRDASRGYERGDTMSVNILLVEDDSVLRKGLTDLFTREGYAVTQATSVAQAKAKCSGGVDLVVLDVSLPDGDGVALCGEWRERGMRKPILFLTAKDEEFDVVRGLDAGGNDYVTKPFRMQELLSRIRVLLRTGEEPLTSRGALEIDPTRMRVTKDGEPVALTLTEYKVLTALVRRKGVVARETLLSILWDDGAKYVDDNTLSVHMSRLREKVGANRIRTIRGVGYEWMES